MSRRVAVVSGGSRGLGREIVRGFLDDSETAVATFSRSGSDFVGEMEERFGSEGRFLHREVDLTDRAGVKGFVSDVREGFGPIDVLVNNAGVARDGVLALAEDRGIDQMLDVNLRGTMALTKECVRAMIPRRSGRIVNVTSIVARRGYRGLSVYSLTKAGLEGMTRSLARELGDRGITVNAVAPGYLETEMTDELTEEQQAQIVRRTPLQRLGTAEDVVPLIRFLCSDRADFITGQVFVVDGGLSA